MQCFRILLPAILLAGCQSTSMYLATDTSIGLDISGSATLPDEVSLSLKRRELQIIPEVSAGAQEHHAALTKIDADLSWFDGDEIYEVIATGHAANCAALASAKSEGVNVDVLKTAQSAICPEVFGQSDTHNEAASTPPIDISDSGSSTNDKKQTSDPKDERILDKALIFSSYTNVGLNVFYGQTQSPGMNLGYKRRVGAKIPLREGKQVRSVYADFAFSSIDGTTLLSPENTRYDPCTGGARKTLAGEEASHKAKNDMIVSDSGVRIRQAIATGAVAQILAYQSNYSKAAKTETETATVTETETEKPQGCPAS